MIFLYRVVNVHIVGQVLWRKFIDGMKRFDNYVEEVNTLEGSDFEIIGKVSDGLGWL